MQLVIQPTRFCNIQCRYCYLAETSDKTKISKLTLDLIGKHIIRPNAQKKISVLWHGCEPLSLSTKFYEHAFNTLRSYTSASLTHFFQTNGTLINDEWIDFIKAHNIQMGVSVDGPEKLHDRGRPYRSGRGSFSDVIAGITLLKKHGVPFDCIGVLTAETVRHPHELFEFFSTIGAEAVSLAPEEQLGNNRDTTLSQCPEELELFWRTYLALAQNGTHTPRIEEFVQPLARAQEAPESNSDLTRAGAYVMVDVDGFVSTFSPEFLTWAGPDRQTYLFTHVSDPHCLDFSISPAFREVRDAISLGVEKCRNACTYFAFCGGGSPAAKALENGSCNSTETFACKARIKMVIDAIRHSIEG